MTTVTSPAGPLFARVRAVCLLALRSVQTECLIYQKARAGGTTLPASRPAPDLATVDVAFVLDPRQETSTMPAPLYALQPPPCPLYALDPPCTPTAWCAA